MTRVADFREYAEDYEGDPMTDLKAWLNDIDDYPPHLSADKFFGLMGVPFRPRLVVEARRSAAEEQE